VSERVNETTIPFAKPMILLVAFVPRVPPGRFEHGVPCHDDQ
jgi:hypothetical protein